MIFPIHVQLRTQRFWIIEGSSFDTHQLRPYRQFGSNGRSTFAAEMSIYSLPAISNTFVCLERASFYGHIGFLDTNHNRKRRPGRLLTRPAVTHRRKERLGTTSVPQRSAQTRTCDLLHHYSPNTQHHPQRTEPCRAGISSFKGYRLCRRQALLTRQDDGTSGQSHETSFCVYRVR